MKKPAPKQKNPLFLILAATFAVKAAYWWFSRTGPFYEPTLLDPGYYDEWARRIIRGEWSPASVFYGLPLYPYFLAIVYKCSEASFTVVKWAQLLLGLGTIFYVYRTAELLRDRRAAVIAGVIAAFYGPLFFHEQILIPESIGMPLYAAAFYWACRLWEEPTAKRGVWFGVTAGLACLTKAGIMPFVFLLPILFKFAKRPLGAALIALAAFFAVLAPVTAHNYFRGHDTVLLTSHSGFNFYIGNNERAEGVFLAPEGTGNNIESQVQDSRAIAERAAGRPLKPSEISKYWSDKAWAFIGRHPGAFLQLCARKLALFFDAREISDVDDYAFGTNFNPLLKFPWLNFALLGPLVLMGLGLGLRGLKNRALVYTWTFGYLGGLIFFFVNARYRLPLLPVFFVIAGASIAGLADAWKERRFGALALSAVLLAAGVGVTRLELVGTDHLRDYLSAGDVYHKKNDFERAMDFYKQALAVDPRSPKANLAMGLVMAKMGDEDRARDYYLTVIEADPRNDQALNNLGYWYERHNELDRAKTYFLQAIEANPNSSQAHNNLGMVVAKMGDPDRAIREFQESLRINPSSARALTNMGLVLHHEGRREEARAAWKKALEIDPAFPEAKKALSL